MRRRAKPLLSIKRPRRCLKCKRFVGVGSFAVAEFQGNLFGVGIEIEGGVFIGPLIEDIKTAGFRQRRESARPGVFWQLVQAMLCSFGHVALWFG